MSASNDLRADLIKPFAACLSQAVQEQTQSPVTNADASNSSLVDLLQHFDDELGCLDDDARTALLAVYRRELTLLVFHFRIETIGLQFTSRHRH